MGSSLGREVESCNSSTSARANVREDLGTFRIVGGLAGGCPVRGRRLLLTDGIFNIISSFECV